MRIYPIRTTRNKWIIKIYCYHKCTTGCETILINRDEYFEVIINPNYNHVYNHCNQLNNIEPGFISLYSFDRNNPTCESGGSLFSPDEIVIPDKSFTLNVDFPLSYSLNIEMHSSRNFTKKDLIYAIKSLYKFIYDEEERTATPQLFKLNKICSNCNLESLEKHVEETKVDDDDCCICYNSLQLDSIKLKCSHIFHRSCITKWIKTSATCPICRTNIFTCTNCDGTGIIFYYFTGIVIPVEQRGERINRNLSNGIFGIHSYDFETLLLSDITYDRLKKNLSFKISV